MEKQALTISTTDRALLAGQGVCFSEAGVVFPKGTARSPGIVSESLGRKRVLWRYHLPQPGLLEVRIQE